MTSRAGDGIAVFAKTPGLSPVKTRLAAEIGAAAALEFYCRSLAITERLCRRVMAASGGGAQCYWAVGEIEGVGDPRWDAFPSFHTGDGGLGTRLANVQDRLLARHGRAMLLGSDCPQLGPGRIADALAMPGEPAVVGPTRDGGFYLWLSSGPVARSVWESVRYSCAETLDDLLGMVGRDRVAFLPEEEDVDDLGSLRRVARRLRAGTVEGQRGLAEWIDGLPGAPGAGGQPLSGADRNIL